jgi:hypothetical protein
VAGARGLANEVRTGLDPKTGQSQVVTMEKKVHPLDEVWMGRPIRTHIREFGGVFATLFLIIAGVQVYKGSLGTTQYVLMGAAGVFTLLGYFAPTVLKPLWRAWMKLAHVLSIVMTFVILGVIWCIGFLPMAGIVRMLGIRVVDQSYGNKETYWVKRDPKYDDFSRLKQQY